MTHMQSGGARVLIVDDHDPWRREVSSLLQESTGWEIVDEAADGHEAVEKAEALRPDLILLDIELPRANGLEAARRILALDPNQRILFVTGHRSWDIAEAALATGARGYILKADAGSELLPAMEAIVQDKRFISPVLAGRPQAREGSQPHRHEAVCCADDLRLLDEYARVAGAALDSGKAFILVSLASRREDLDERLRADGVDLALAITQRRYVWMDVPEAFSPFMVDGFPDEGRFWKTAPALIMEAARESTGSSPGVAVCGDGAGSLWAEGKVEAAIRVEQLWDELVRTYNVDMLCGYHMKTAPQDEDGRVFQRLCSTHTAVHSR